MHCVRAGGLTRGFRSCSGLLFTGALVLVPVSARAHPLWIETEASVEVGREFAVGVYWGHAGQRETGEMLAGQREKLSACVLGPGGRADLPLAQADDRFVAKFAPETRGTYVFGADLQVGLIDQEKRNHSHAHS